MKGATNTSLNGYYDTVDNMDCELRDVHKHEILDVYLYFKWSDTQNEYFWFVDQTPCTDGAFTTALIQNDDYSVSPELVFDEWEEKNSAGTYVVNAAIDVDCFSKS